MKQLSIIFIMVLIMRNGFSQNPPKREMRGVWIATVENIDWPSSPGLKVKKQKKELCELLDQVKAYNMNTVVLQIRPAADAFYQSDIEPWSQWLTGKQGVAPDPWYDPLEYAVTECRKRGLDIHVWLNPYRVLRDTAYESAATHVTKTHPDWVVIYGSVKYFDPGLPQVRDHVAGVVADIVRRYDIDAVHMDDYFYPYRIADEEFPDSLSFIKYGGDYSLENKDDWRRHNTDLIIQQINDSIKSIKPWVEFGISPFGVWRNASVDSTGSDTRAGQTNFDDLFADILKWQKEGWIDYVVPQLYWHIGFGAADYKVLAQWWNNNTYGCPLYIGHALYRLDPESGTEAWRSSDEIIRQISMNRSLSHISGSIFYSAKFLKSNPLSVKENLIKDLYRSPAFVPENPHITSLFPDKPVNTVIKKGWFRTRLFWEKGSNTSLFVVYRIKKGDPHDISRAENIFITTADTTLRFTNNKDNRLSDNDYLITSMSSTWTECEPVLFEE